VHGNELNADVDNTVGSGRDKTARCDGRIPRRLRLRGRASRGDQTPRAAQGSEHPGIPSDDGVAGLAVLPGRATSAKPIVALAPDALIRAISKAISPELAGAPGQHIKVRRSFGAR
jgi:hypothetical protein